MCSRICEALNDGPSGPRGDLSHRAPVRDRSGFPELHRADATRTSCGSIWRSRRRPTIRTRSAWSAETWPGCPNGRRVFDDVVTVELRAIAGATYPLVAPDYKPDAAVGAVTDGLGPSSTTLPAEVPVPGDAAERLPDRTAGHGRQLGQRNEHAQQPTRHRAEARALPDLCGERQRHDRRRRGARRAGDLSGRALSRARDRDQPASTATGTGSTPVCTNAGRRPEPS